MRGGLSSPPLFVCSGVCSTTLKDAYSSGLRAVLESNIEKDHYRDDDGELSSLRGLPFIMT